jgi:hypothetical protein
VGLEGVPRSSIEKLIVVFSLDKELILLLFERESLKEGRGSLNSPIGWLLDM